MQFGTVACNVRAGFSFTCKHRVYINAFNFSQSERALFSLIIMHIIALVACEPVGLIVGHAAKGANVV